MSLRERVRQLEAAAKARADSVAALEREVKQLYCQLDTGHTFVFTGVQDLSSFCFPGFSHAYVFECSGCGARIWRCAEALTDAQRAGLLALGYDVPAKPKKGDA
ncbi:MAG: hypothetical protein WC455_22595 [Dehalococcoidia bacterium]|jgi:hypothetical protein